MRFYGFALAGLLLGQAASLAQQPTLQAPQAPAGTLDPARDPLDALLVRWEQEFKKIETFSAECSQTVDDKTFQTTDVFVGSIKYVKPGLAKLELRKRDNPAIEEKFIFTGTYLYHWRSQQKKIYYHALPPSKMGQVADDNFLALLFGTKAAEVKRRYDLRLDQPQDGSAQYYYYLLVVPRYPADRADFVRAQLVLRRDNYLPRRLWLEKPNRNTELWDFGKIETNIPIPRTEFQKPEVPPGWKIEEAPRPDAPPQPQIQPRVVRPNGGQP